MKTTASFKKLVLGSLVTICASNFAFAEDAKIKLQDIKPQLKAENTFDPKLDSEEVKKLIETKALQQRFLKGIKTLQTGGNTGGGGDEVGLDFQRALQNSLENMRTKMPELYQSLEKHQLDDVATSAKIIVVDEALNVEVKDLLQTSVAVNLPESSTILVNRSRWNALTDNKLKESIALHEILSLKKVESTGSYPVSSKYISREGTSSKKLESSLKVNSIKQIQTLAPEAKPYEVLKELFSQASSPITDEDLIRFSGKQYECAEVDQESSISTAQMYTKETRQDIPAEPARGPLLPGKAAVPKGTKMMVSADARLVSDLGQIINQERLNAEITQYGVVTTSLMSLPSYKVTIKYRTTNGMLAVEKKYGPVYVIYMYCWKK